MISSPAAHAFSGDRSAPQVSTFRVYSTFVRTAFLSILAYRLRYYTGIVTYILFVSVHYFIWQAVFASVPPGQTAIHGFTLNEMVTYLAVGWIARSCYFSTIDEDLDEMVRSGRIALVLLRPVNLHGMFLAQALGESLFRVLFFTAPIAIVVTQLYDIQLPPNAGAAALFGIASIGSFFIMAEINFLVGLLAFSLSSIQGVSRAKYALTQLLSGLLLPIAFFPDWFRTIIEWLPFSLMTSVPMQLYLGKVSPHGAHLLLRDLLAWCLLLALCSEILWRRSIRSLSIHGG